MKKLHDLRDYLLTSPLGLTADKLLTFALSGKVTSYAGLPHQNRSFRVAYQAHVIVTDFAGDETALMYLVTDWVQRNQPGAAPDAVSFQLDIISHRQVDLSILVALEEVVAVQQQEAGTRLTPLGDGNALAGSLFGVIPRP